jgi:hypothetical protein
MRYDGGMESWDRHRPIWLAKLVVVRAELEHDIRPASPAEGILATCQLSDEARTFAQAALRMQYPLLSPAEIEAMYFEQRVTWTRQRQRLSIHGCSTL